MVALIFLFLGFVAVMMALSLLIPVAVNFPASWFGALEILLLLSGGGAMIYLGVKIIHARKTRERT